MCLEFLALSLTGHSQAGTETEFISWMLEGSSIHFLHNALKRLQRRSFSAFQSGPISLAALQI